MMRSVRTAFAMLLLAACPRDAVPTVHVTTPPPVARRPTGWLAVSYDGELRLIDVSSGGVTVLARSPNAVLLRPTFSPDGKRVSYSAWYVDANRNERGEIRVVGVDGKGDVAVATCSSGACANVGYSSGGVLHYAELLGRSAARGEPPPAMRLFQVSSAGEVRPWSLEVPDDCKGFADLRLFPRARTLLAKSRACNSTTFVLRETDVRVDPSTNLAAQNRLVRYKCALGMGARADRIFFCSDPDGAKPDYSTPHLDHARDWAALYSSKIDGSDSRVEVKVDDAAGVFMDYVVTLDDEWVIAPDDGLGQDFVAYPLGGSGKPVVILANAQASTRGWYDHWAPEVIR